MLPGLPSLCCGLFATGLFILGNTDMNKQETSLLPHEIADLKSGVPTAVSMAVAVRIAQLKTLTSPPKTWDMGIIVYTFILSSYFNLKCVIFLECHNSNSRHCSSAFILPVFISLCAHISLS